MSNTLKDLDTLVFILERVFRSHEAHLQEVPNGMEILDFYAPDNRTINSLHIVFDRRGGRVYITGDLGDAIIQPTCAASLQGMAKCFTRREEDGKLNPNIWYFLEKINVSSDMFKYSGKDFDSDFRERCAQLGYHDLDEFIEEHFDEWSDEFEIDEERGITIGSDTKKALKVEIDPDYRIWFFACGKRINPRVVAWLVAIRLAWEAVRDGKAVQA